MTELKKHVSAFLDRYRFKANQNRAEQIKRTSEELPVQELEICKKQIDQWITRIHDIVKLLYDGLTQSEKDFLNAYIEDNWSKMYRRAENVLKEISNFERALKNDIKLFSVYVVYYKDSPKDISDNILYGSFKAFLESFEFDRQSDKEAKKVEYMQLLEKQQKLWSTFSKLDDDAKRYHGEGTFSSMIR
jgi:hypothetical protein